MYSWAANENQELQMNPQDEISCDLACLHTLIRVYKIGMKQVEDQPMFYLQAHELFTENIS